MKRTTKKLNSLFWFLLAILPILMKIIAFTAFQSGADLSDETLRIWSDWYDGYFNGMFDAGYAIYTDIIVPLFKAIKFNPDSGNNLFTSNDMAVYVAHFIGVYTMRFLADVILFIPRFMSNLLDRSDK